MLEVIEDILQQFSLPVNPFTIGVLVLNALFLTIIVVLLISISVNKWFQNYLRVKEKKLRNKAEEIVFAWIEEELTLHETAKALKAIVVQKTFELRVLVQLFHDFSKSFKGDTLENMQALFSKTGLDEHSIQQLKRNAWEDKAVVLRILGQMKVSHAQETLLHLAMKKDRLYRGDSLAALIEVGDFDWIDTFSYYKRTVSDMDQILIIEKINKIDPPPSEVIKHWLKSENPDIVVLAIRLVYLYNHFDLIDEVVAHLDHENTKVRFVVLMILRMQGADGYENSLAKFLTHANPDETIMVFRMMAFNPEFVERKVLDKCLKSANPLIRYNAMRLLYFRDGDLNKKQLTREESTMLQAVVHETHADDEF